MAGVFVSRGITISVPVGGLTISIGDDGQPVPNLTLHVRFDVCPTWCELALKHLADARVRRTDREAAWAGTDEEQKGVTLEREFESSMQAIMAAAIAFDAFYSVLQTHVRVPGAMTAQWRAKRTPRYSQVTEVVRRAFRLKPKGTRALRNNLKEIYKMRDLAVHPSGKIAAPLLHPEINVGVEWRFAWFRASNAELVVNAATAMLWDLSHNGKATDPKIIEYAVALRQRLIQMFPQGHPSQPAPNASVAR